MRNHLLVTLCLLGLAFPAGAEKPRDWQTGKLVDSERSREYAGSSGSVNVNGTPGYSERAVYHPTQTVVIEGRDYAYTVVEDNSGPSWHPLPQKLANLTVNAPIKYAVEKQKLYLIDDNGKEHKMEIVKRVLIPKP
jgi:hypothetical protein